jgi:hypothetical protein
LALGDERLDYLIGRIYRLRKSACSVLDGGTGYAENPVGVERSLCHAAATARGRANSTSTIKHAWTFLELTARNRRFG